MAGLSNVPVTFKSLNDMFQLKLVETIGHLAIKPADNNDTSVLCWELPT